MNFKSAVEILRDMVIGSFSTWSPGLLKPVSIRMRDFLQQKRIEATRKLESGQRTIRPTILDNNFFSSQPQEDTKQLKTVKPRGSFFRGLTHSRSSSKDKDKEKEDKVEPNNANPPPATATKERKKTMLSLGSFFSSKVIDLPSLSDDEEETPIEETS